MNFLLVLSVLLALSAQGYAQNQISCFTCTNCPGPFDESLHVPVVCSIDIPTPTMAPIIPPPDIIPSVAPITTTQGVMPSVSAAPTTQGAIIPTVTVPPTVGGVMPSVSPTPTVGGVMPTINPMGGVPQLPNITLSTLPTDPLPIPTLAPGGPTLPDITPSTINVAKNQQTLSRERRQLAVEFQCFRMRNEVNGVEIFTRGCVVRQDGGNSDTCRHLNGGSSPDWCRICTSDNCNSANGVRLSLLTVVLSVILITLRIY